MKTTILPYVRIEPALGSSVESMLKASQTEFVTRGLMSLENAKRAGEYVASEQVLDKLAQKLEDTKSKLKVTQK